MAEPNIAAVYLPLHGTTHLGLDTADGAAVVIAPGIAVTNAHNSNLLDEKSVLGYGSASDLMFFRTSRQEVPETAPPAIGGTVIAYGQGGSANLRVARGVTCIIAAGNPDSPYFIFTGNAGPGFSGGPVLNLAGRLVGITFAYLDSNGRRLIFAYDMKRVRDEFQRIQPRQASDEAMTAQPPDYSGCGRRKR